MSSHKKILLVDDDKDDQLFFVDAIKELEPTLECGIANNGLEAISHLEKIPPLPSLIFLDLNMPFMNGYECLAQLQKTNEYKEIPINIFTTSNHAVDFKRTMSMGAKMYVIKPPDFNTLKTRLHDILEMNFAMANC
jgi:CheY-like chemotaxis protein